MLYLLQRLLKQLLISNIFLIIILSLLSIQCGKKTDSNFYESKGIYNYTIIKKDSLTFVYKDSIYVGQIEDIQLWNNKILISDFNKHLLVFDDHLTFIKMIGKNGRGPNEFTFPPIIVMGCKNLILIKPQEKKYCTYNENLDFLEEKKLPDNYYYTPNNPLNIGDKYILYCIDPSVYNNKDIYKNNNSLYAFDKNFNIVDNFYRWGGYYLDHKYYAYDRATKSVLLAKSDNGFFASQTGNVEFAYFTSDLKNIKTFGLKPKYFIDPPIEPDILKTQRSMETAIEFSTTFTYRDKIIYDKLNKYLILGYSNYNKDSFYKKSLLIGDHYLQIFDKNYDCIFDGSVPGLLAFTNNGLVYILTEQTDKYIKFYGYEIVKK